MKDLHTLPQVGAPDHELQNSPVFDESDADYLSLDLELEIEDEGGDDSGELSLAVVAGFQSADSGGEIRTRSGDELLRCEEKGVWVREGTCPQR